eukprot:8180-Pyramimonas_sp.AAC.1
MQHWRWKTTTTEGTVPPSAQGHLSCTLQVRLGRTRTRRPQTTQSPDRSRSTGSQPNPWAG